MRYLVGYLKKLRGPKLCKDQHCCIYNLEALRTSLADHCMSIKDDNVDSYYRLIKVLT